jgi:hypothetical protein
MWPIGQLFASTCGNRQTGITGRDAGISTSVQNLLSAGYNEIEATASAHKENSAKNIVCCFLHLKNCKERKKQKKCLYLTHTNLEMEPKKIQNLG